MKNNFFTKNLCLFIWMGVMLWVSHASWAADYYVDAVNGLDEPGRGTPEKPWKTITYALSQVSGTGHTIHVAKGTYDLTLGEVFPLSMKNGVNLIGAGSDVAIIDAKDKASVVKAEYISTETKIAGFTLKDGKSSTYGGGIIYRWSSGNLTVDSCKITSCYSAKEGGGIYASESPDGDLLIHDCQITGCTSGAGWGSGKMKGGAGVYVYKTPVGILRCEIFSNSLPYGGGAGILIRESQSAEVAFNSIHHNISYVGGGMVYCISKGTITGNFIYSNEATYYDGGGGIYIVPGGESKQVVVRNNLIKGNTVDYDGAGIVVQDSPFVDKTRSYDIIVNNTITANGSDIECRGAGIRLDSTLYYFYTIVKNNIVTGNDIGIEVVMLSPGLWKGTVAYNDFWNNECSDYEGIQPGVGDIHEDPMFVDAANGDYHLQSAKYGHWTPTGWSPPDPKTSPCIDAGDPNDDFSLEPEPNGKRINQGFDGNTPEATRSDPLPHPHPVHYVSPSGKNIPPYDTPEKAAVKIQDAINEATSGDTVKVAEGTYSQYVQMKKGVALEGGYNSSFTSRKPGVYKSFINGGTQSDTVIGANDTILDGFVLYNYLWHSTIRCDGVTSMKISHNIITGGDNAAIELHASSPTIVNNVIAYDYSMLFFASIWCADHSSPIIENNIFFSSYGTGEPIGHDGTSTPIAKYNFSGGDPLFVNPKEPAWNPDYDFHLKPGSPCIDAGDPDFDYSLEPKPNGCRIDMGAYGNTPEATPSGIYGDVSKNGTVSAYDAALVLQHVVGIIVLTCEQQQMGDVSDNGTISSYDAALILQYTVGLITKFPVEEILPAPILAGKDEDKLLSEAIVMIENVPLSIEQRQVLEQLKRLLYQQKLLPTHTVLLQNYPNPFNPETWIPFKLAEGGKATITIYDVHGRLVRTLSLGYVPAGVYQTKAKAAYWDGKNEASERVASGVYFYNLQSGKFSATRKMVISK